MAIGFTDGGEEFWLKKALQALIAARAASINVMAHNCDDQAPVFKLQDTIEDAIKQTQTICTNKKIIPP